MTPVDLFPDALPILGFIDDLVFVPLAVALAIRFVPSPVLAECRPRAHERVVSSRSSWIFVFGLWAAPAAAVVVFAL